MKQIVDKLNKIAKKIDESVEIPQTDLIIDSLDAITKAYGGTPNDSNLIVDKLEDIYNNISPAVSGNIEITENGENINVAPYATATVNVSGGGEMPTITLNIHNTSQYSEVSIPTNWGGAFGGFFPFTNGYIDLNGIDTSLLYDLNETKSFVSVPTGTIYVDDGDQVAGGFGFSAYTPDNPTSAVSDLVNCTIKQYEIGGDAMWCLLITDITKDASATINLEMSR